MNPIEWFYAKGDKHSGPVNSAELKRMATAGELKPEDLVWREGMADWTIARNVRGLFDEENKPAGSPAAAGASPAGAPPKVIEPVAMPTVAPASPTAATPTAFAATAPQVQKSEQPGKHLFDLLLAFLRKQFTASFVESTTKLFVILGKYGLYAAMVLTFAFWAIVALKSKEYGLLGIGIANFLALAVLQYVGGRFCEVSERLNRNTSAAISSTAFLDCFALLNIATGTALLIVSLIVGIPAKEFWWIIVGVAGFVITHYLAFIALHSSTINVNLVAELRAGEEALGLISFFPKALVKLASVIFGAIAIAGSLMLLDACIELFIIGEAYATKVAEMADEALRFSAALPFVAYLIFLIIFLFLDICRAILVLPSKFERTENHEVK